MYTRIAIISFLLLFISYRGLLAQEDLLKQKITIHEDASSLHEIINEITSQSGINFAFNNKKVDTEQILDLHVDDQELEKVLQELSSMINLEYKFIEGQIVLKKASKKSGKSIVEFTISGFLKDMETGESLIGATVYVEELLAGTVTNAYGFYSLTLPKDEYAISFSYIGYLKQEKKIILDGNVQLDFDLPQNKQLLSTLIVSNHEEEEKLKTPQMSQIKIYPKQLNTMPEFGGEVGLVKSLQTFPGIKTHSDGSSFFFVRGGTRDQNLLLIDDAPLFNVAHLFGYYSIIVPDVTKEIKIYKGDMPVSQGDRISSIIDIKTKDGNLKQFEANGMLNPLVYRFSVEGPFKKDKSSFYTSFRHSNFKWIYNRFVPELNIYFADFTTKLNLSINKNNRLFFTYFYGKDNVTTQNQGVGGIIWENFTYTLRWNHIFNTKLFSNTMIYFSSYEYDLFIEQVQDSIKWVSAIKSINFKTDFTYYSSPNTTLRFGFNQSLHAFNPGNIDNPLLAQLNLGVAKTQSRKSAFYLSREKIINEKLSYNVGFRMPIWLNYGPTTVYQFDEDYNVSDSVSYASGQNYKGYINFDPRLSLRYKTGKRSSLKLSMGIYHQYLQVLSSSISPFTPLEVWLPSGVNIKPQRADQATLGFNQFIGKKSVELTVEAYYKFMRNQIEYEPHSELLLNPYIEGELRFGTARSYGLELMLNKSKGRFSGWIAYTLSRTFKKINDLNDGKEFPAFYDRPHDLSIYFSYQISHLVNFSANWIYYTGSAITTPIGFFEHNSYSVPIYGSKNNDRLPNYHRLDISLNLKLNRSEKKFEHYLNFGIYNLYNRHNPISVNFNKVETQNGQFVVPANFYGNNTILNTEKYIMGIMPSITYKFRL